MQQWDAFSGLKSSTTTAPTTSTASATATTTTASEGTQAPVFVYDPQELRRYAHTVSPVNMTRYENQTQALKRVVAGRMPARYTVATASATAGPSAGTSATATAAQTPADDATSISDVITTPTTVPIPQDNTANVNIYPAAQPQWRANVQPQPLQQARFSSTADSSEPLDRAANPSGPTTGRVILQPRVGRGVQRRATTTRAERAQNQPRTRELQQEQRRQQELAAAELRRQQGQQVMLARQTPEERERHRWHLARQQHQIQQASHGPLGHEATRNEWAPRAYVPLHARGSRDVHVDPQARQAQQVRNAQQLIQAQMEQEQQRPGTLRPPQPQLHPQQQPMQGIQRHLIGQPPQGYIQQDSRYLAPTFNDRTHRPRQGQQQPQGMPVP